MARVGSWEGEIGVMVPNLRCSGGKQKGKNEALFLDSKFEMHLELHDSL